MNNYSYEPEIRVRGILLGLGLVILAGTFVTCATSPARAQEASWERGCAQRVVAPGSGDALRVHNCTRQRGCQQEANRVGHTIYHNGCIGVSPSTARAEGSR